MRKCRCGGDLRVKDCRPSGITFRRTRICDSCNRRQLTYEYSEEEIAEIKRESQGQLLDEIRTMMKRY